MRRRITIFAVVIASAALAACSDVVAPTSHAEDCRSGYISSDGRFICTDPG